MLKHRPGRFSITWLLAAGIAVLPLACDDDHHGIAITRAPRSELSHYAYQWSEFAALGRVADRLKAARGRKCIWGPSRHGPGNNLFVFFDDPAGNHIELSAEMEKFHDDRVEYVPRRWVPVPGSVNLWGGQLPNWRKVSASV